MIRELVRAFAEETLAPTVAARDRDQRPPAEEWQAFLELGLQGVTIPEAYDGAPMDDITESIIVEELARVDPSFAVMFCVHVGFVCQDDRPARNEEQKQRYLTRLAAGEVGILPLRGWFRDGRCDDDMQSEAQ